MLLSVKKQRIIENVDSSCVRGSIVNGVYEYAKFSYGKNNFTVVASYKDEKGVESGSLILKNGIKYVGSIVSNGRYRDIALGNGDSLMEHQLLAVCLIPGATAQLLDETTNNVINHKVISSKSLEARQARYDDVVYWMQCLEEGKIDEYDRTKYQSKAYQPPCDVHELEVCTSAENVAHGSFIKTFGLYDLPISAHDIPLLKQFIIDKDRVEYAMNLYTNYGAETMTRMIVGC